jgi:hypothetical protein
MKKLTYIILAAAMILFLVGCLKEEVNEPKETKQIQAVSYKEVILNLEDFTLRSGPDSIFAITNAVLDNILVSDNNLNREITSFNIYAIRNIVLTPDSLGGDIGYQNTFFQKYDYVINWKDNSQPFTGNAYVRYVGDTTYTYTPNSSNNTLHSFAPKAIKWTRIEARTESLKMLHPFNTTTVSAWKWRRTRLFNGNWIFIEDVFLAPNNKSGSFNVPLIF